MQHLWNNPQKFIEIAAEAINRRKRLALVEGIKYGRSGDEAYYAQELFVKEELTGYLNKMLKSKKSVYDHVIWDSDNEAKFAEQFGIEHGGKGVRQTAEVVPGTHSAGAL